MSMYTNAYTLDFFMYIVAIWYSW